MQRTQARIEADQSAARAQKLKGVIAVTIIVLCLGFLTWLFWPKPAVVIPPPQDQVALWEKAFAQVNVEEAAKISPLYKLFGEITAQPSEDRQSIVVMGSVSSYAELNVLKAELGKVQPAVPLQWEVTVGR